MGSQALEYPKHQKFTFDQLKLLCFQAVAFLLYHDNLFQRPIATEYISQQLDVQFRNTVEPPVNMAVLLLRALSLSLKKGLQQSVIFLVLRTPFTITLFRRYDHIFITQRCRCINRVLLYQQLEKKYTSSVHSAQGLVELTNAKKL